MCRIAAGLAFAFAAATLPLHAQRVRGELTDSATHEAVPGAVVVLYDSAGRGLERVISDDRGRYTIIRPPLARTLRITRIGFQPRDVALGADSVIDARLQTIPALLHEMRATDDRVCRDGPNTANALALWEQARAGLLASVVSREAMPPNIRLRTFQRSFDPVTRRMIADTVTYIDVVDARSFVAARAPWVFADDGYLREEPGGNREYYAPDDAVLLDPTFAATHCLHVIEGRGPRGGQLGMAFDPIGTADRDTIVDVAGALWLDRETFAPRSIEFRYTNLERENRDTGGLIDFAVMPNGVSMIQQWEVHSAILAIELPSTPLGVKRREVPRADRRNVRVLGYRRTGGQIAYAVWPDGKRFDGNLPHIEGVVRYVDGTPAPDAVVWVRGAPDTVRTDSTGHFRFPPMEPGLYTVSASDSILATLGVSRAVATHATLLTTGNAEANLEYHSRTDVFPAICPTRSYRPGTGVMLARVLDSRGKPVPNAHVEIETRRIAEKPELVGRRNGQTSDDGRFVVCGAERDQRLVVRAFNDNEGAGVAIDRWGDEVVAVTLTLRPLKP